MPSANTAMAPRTALAALAILPIAAPTVYLLCLKYRVSRNTTSTTGRTRPSKRRETASQPGSGAETPKLPISLPADVRHGSDSDPDSQWILSYERVVSRPLRASSLAYPVPVPEAAPPGNPDASSSDERGISALLRAYSQAVQIAFSWTPQAFAIRASLKDDRERRTFEGDWIRGLSFEEGDVVNAAYCVSYRGRGQGEGEGESEGGLVGSERVEMRLRAPSSYKGNVPGGLIVSEVQVVEDDAEEGKREKKTGRDGEVRVVFVNETWMWRKTEEKPTLIESSAGSWLHTLLAEWLVMKGVAAVTDRKRA